jgi:SnoaL-like domain
MDVSKAAERWADIWQRAWTTGDPNPIAKLYAEDATYRSHPMRNPEPGGALAYTRREFALEQAVECRFGEPISTRDRAAVEWWASWVENEREVTLAGATVLRFDEEGRVQEHVDYWVEGEGRIPPFSGWGGRPSRP